MDVSVIIPTFNRPELLQQTLQSVLQQTIPAREIIVVDNGTNDDTRTMIEANYGSAVLYLRERRRGVQCARNKGIDLARGRWIATLDDDDLYHADFLEAFRPAVTDGCANLIYSDHRKFVDSEGARVPFAKTNFESAPQGYWDNIPRACVGQHWSLAGKFPPERILRFNAFYPSAMLIRKALVRQVGGFDPEVFGIKAEDIEFLLRALIAGTLAIVWRPLVDYRIHESNVSGGDWLCQMVGRWRIFEYAYARGSYGCRSLHRALEADLPIRRLKTFDQAWRHSLFRVVDELGPLLREDDWTLLRRLRVIVGHAPRPLRSAIMHLRDAAAAFTGAGAAAPRISSPA